MVFSMPLLGQEVLRGEVRVDLEPLYMRDIEKGATLDTASARKSALEEAAMIYSAMIYGWSFEYEIGEKARGIPENFELTPLGAVSFGDPGLRVTDVDVRGMLFCLWTDYILTEMQMRRMRVWQTGTVRSLQAQGKGPLGGPLQREDLAAIRKAALEDAARAGVRAMLRGMERNRPRAARGFIALAEFPVYRIDAGYWTVSARFRVELTGIEPFAAY